jgi:putative two-component system response regulator
MAIMRTHAVIWAARAIEKSERDLRIAVPFLAVAKEIAHWHHEKWDGSGYPDGLSGDSIPVSARLMAIADVFDALISQRVYKAAMTAETARNIIAQGRATHFDPDMVDAFLASFDGYLAIANSHSDAG